MKYLKGAFALGLLPTRAFAQAVVTVSLPTCIPGGDKFAVPGPTTEVTDVTVTESLGSVTVEPITQVVTPGAFTPEPSTFVALVTTTNSLGSTLVETTTSVTTPPVQFTPPPGTSPAAGPNVATTPAGPAPVGPASVGPPSVGPAPVESTPVGPASVGPPSVGPATPAPPGPTTAPVATSAAPPPPPPPATTAAPPPPATTAATGPAPIQTVGGTPSCPANNGSYYETVFGNTYDINCGNDYVGVNGTVPFHADSYVKCLESCDLLEGCLAVTYSTPASASDTNCLPWYDVTSGTYTADPNLMAGQNVNGPNPGTDTPDAYCDPAGANQTIITDFFGYNYYVGCSQQYNCPDLLAGVLTTNMEACIDYCSIYDGCLAVGWTEAHPVQAPNSPNCFTFGSYNNTLSYNATVNYAVLQTPQNPA